MRPLACWDCGFDSLEVWMSVSCECCVLSGPGEFGVCAFKYN